MARHTREMEPAMHAKWRTVLHKLFLGQPAGSWPSNSGFNQALHERFGLELSEEEPDCARHSAPELGQWH